jgi:hypothetical protein
MNMLYIKIYYENPQNYTGSISISAWFQEVLEEVVFVRSLCSSITGYILVVIFILFINPFHG